MIGKSLVTLALATSALGASVLTAPSVISDLFQPTGAAQDSEPLTFTLHLNSPNYPSLAARTADIASSGASWLTEEDVAQYMKPAPADSQAVRAYLAAKGVPDSAISTSKFGEDIKISTTVAQAKQLFPDTQFSLFSFLSKNIVRTNKLVLPAPLDKAVFHVGGLLDFPEIKRLSPIIPTMLAEEEQSTDLQKRADTTDCDASKVVPSCLRHYYGTFPYAPAQSNATYDITVMGYIGQYVSQADLTTFLKKYRPDAADYQIPIQTAQGAINDQTKPGIEAMLDVETVIGQSYPLKTNFLSFGAVDDPNDIFADTFDYFLTGDGASVRPSVISISYGAGEKDVTPEQARAMCQKATQLSALGTTITVASGDSGVAGNGLQTGSVCLGTALSPFIPTYPGGCPAIASVGATTKFDKETMVSATLPAVDGFFSGAGASNIFGIPDYQKAQVAAYDKQLNGLQTPPGSYNTTGRRYPDYAANGLNYAVISGGQEQLVGGTSASAPTVAAIFGLLNNALQRAGKPNLGYSQPKLYPLQASGAFNDVTTGGSYGCGIQSALTPIGFPAKAGWDGASGVGTPKFAEIRKGLGA